MDAVAAWEADMLAFIKAGGTEPDDEDKRSQLIKILPSNCSMETLDKADEQTTADSLIDWMRAKQIFHIEHGERGGSPRSTSI